MPGLLERLRSLFRKQASGPENERARRGQAGEEAAAEFLKKAGYTILAMNWRDKRDARRELDLVCREPGGVLVFVEVKARSEGDHKGGYFSVDRRKKAALREAVNAYLGALAPEHRHHFRFDIIEVTLVAGRPGAVTHHTAVPLFPQRRR